MNEPELPEPHDEDPRSTWRGEPVLYTEDELRTYGEAKRKQGYEQAKQELVLQGDFQLLGHVTEEEAAKWRRTLAEDPTDSCTVPIWKEIIK